MAVAHKALDISFEEKPVDYGDFVKRHIHDITPVMKETVNVRGGPWDTPEMIMARRNVACSIGECFNDISLEKSITEYSKLPDNVMENVSDAAHRMTKIRRISGISAAFAGGASLWVVGGGIALGFNGAAVGAAGAVLAAGFAGGMAVCETASRRLDALRERVFGELHKDLK
jgi:hypothetical protein